jgi:anti-sigma B factor antagonist
MEGHRLGTSVRVERDRAIVALGGELDLANAPALDGVLERPEVAGAVGIVLDLQELQFLDSSGLRAILRAQRLADRRGQGFAVTEGSGQVQRLLSITRASEQLRVLTGADASSTDAQT